MKPIYNVGKSFRIHLVVQDNWTVNQLKMHRQPYFVILHVGIREMAPALSRNFLTLVWNSPRSWTIFLELEYKERTLYDIRSCVSCHVFELSDSLLRLGHKKIRASLILHMWQNTCYALSGSR